MPLKQSLWEFNRLAILKVNMKLIIAGGRDLFVTTKEISDIITEKIGPISGITEIVWGVCSGIDKCGKVFADFYGIKDKPYPAEWTKYGLSAGSRRNLQMAVYADMLLLIWDGKSDGSKNMKKRMLGMKKPVFEVIKTCA